MLALNSNLVHNMKKGHYLSTILRSDKTVFSFNDIALLWGDSSPAARKRMNYYIKEGALFRIRQGIYAKDKNYDKLEFASRVFTPSYVSFETVLGKAGITFQFYSQILVASYLTREIVCDEQRYSFRKLKTILLNDATGVENKNNCSIASNERAFLDTLYINKDYYFDNLSPLDWDEVFRILPIYNNKRITKKVNDIYKNFNLKK